MELALEGRAGVLVTAPLSVREHGFSLHAATRAGAEDPQGREALLKYILRPPIATERIISTRAEAGELPACLADSSVSVRTSGRASRAKASGQGRRRSAQ
jgi:hypothetical protein